MYPIDATYNGAEVYGNLNARKIYSSIIEIYMLIKLSNRNNPKSDIFLQFHEQGRRRLFGNGSELKAIHCLRK